MKINVCGLFVDDLSSKEVLSLIMEATRNSSLKPFSVFSCNVDMIVKAKHSKDFSAVLNSGDIVVPDGMPVVWLGRVLDGDFKERVTGADLIPEIMKRAAENHLTVSFIGAAPGIASVVVDIFQTINKGWKVGQVISPPMGFEKSRDSIEQIISEMEEVRSDITLIALGAPKQEFFINTYGQRLNSSVLIAVGGSLDIISGKVKRAPVWMQRSGLEWVWRLIREPGRLYKRYLIEDSYFIILALKAIFNKCYPRSKKEKKS